MNTKADGPEQREADRLERIAEDSDDECEYCNGSGLITIQIGGDGYGDKCCGVMDCDDQPCPECNEGYWRVKP